MHQEGGRRKNGVFRAITQLTRERCSLCPVNCFDSDTRKPILSTTSTQRSGARHFFEAVDRDNRRSAGILHSSGNGHLEIETSVISLSCSRRSYGLVSGTGKGNDTRGEFQRRRCVELIACLLLEFAVEGDSNPRGGILIRNLGKGELKGNETLCETSIKLLGWPRLISFFLRLKFRRLGTTILTIIGENGALLERFFEPRYIIIVSLQKILEIIEIQNKTNCAENVQLLTQRLNQKRYRVASLSISQRSCAANSDSQKRDAGKTDRQMVSMPLVRPNSSVFPQPGSRFRTIRFSPRLLRSARELARGKREIRGGGGSTELTGAFIIDRSIVDA